jgi:hypothetical protein
MVMQFLQHLDKGMQLRIIPCRWSGKGVETQNWRGDRVMVRPRSRIARILLYGLACVLMCAAFASELPEQLTLTNDPSNDYTLRCSTFLKNIQTVTALGQDTGFFIVAPPRPSWHSLSAVPEGGSAQAQNLFILHSVLRT